MAINFYPKQGMVLICDFAGFKVPEMQKRRPVVVISKYQANKNGLCTIIPFSTTQPDPVYEYHYLLKEGSYNFIHPTKQTWAKCDMVYRVSFERLDRMKIYGKFQTPRLNLNDIQNILKALQSTII